MLDEQAHRRINGTTCLDTKHQVSWRWNGYFRT